MNQAPVRPGDILAGKYRVDRILGAGNMGVVIAASHIGLGHRVALKFMLQQGTTGHEPRERFLREARAVVRLKSQHVAHVLDVGTLENDAPYIVMELLEGQDLSAILRAHGPLSFEDAVTYVLQACEAVGEAHAAGIVHRDIKPANLFLTEDISGTACIKVLDFGVSKLSDADLSLTNEADMLGSPLYMSPEQMSSSRAVDARSDVWALGITLYQLVAGKTPFDAENMARLYSRIATGDATPLGVYRPDAPTGFEGVLQQCFERELALRFQDVAALAAALAPFAPEHARMYPRRVARVLGIKSAAATSVPEILIAPAVTAVTGPATPQSRPSAALSPLSSPLSSSPIPSTPGIIGDTAITVARSQKAAGHAKRSGVIAAALVAVLGIAALGAGGLWLTLRSSPGATAALPESSVATVVTLATPDAHPTVAPAVPAAEPPPVTLTLSAGPVATMHGVAPPISDQLKPQGHSSRPAPLASANAKPLVPPVASSLPPLPPTPPASTAGAAPKKREGIL